MTEKKDETKIIFGLYFKIIVFTFFFFLETEDFFKQTKFFKQIYSFKDSFLYMTAKKKKTVICNPKNI